MYQQCRRNEDGGSGREPDKKSKVPQDKMAANAGVEVPQGCDCAPAKAEVGEVEMGVGNAEGSKVDGAGSPGAVPKHVTEPRIPTKKRVKGAFTVVVALKRICHE